MLIVDSSVWIDYFADRDTPQVRILDEALDQERVGLGNIILCEVLQGIRDEKQFEAVRRQLLNLHIFPVCSLQIAVQAARNYRRLRQEGITVRKTIDALIATFCIEGGHRLLHSDRDFDAFEQHLQLQVVR